MFSRVKPFLSGSVRHVRMLLGDAAYRSYWRVKGQLDRVPRYTACDVRIGAWSLRLPDAASFLSTYHELFVHRIYAFRTDGPSPRILDVGANIGLSVLYFKALYPESRITAVEADPSIFTCLEHNVHGNGYTDVVLVNKAVWSCEAVLEFSVEGADGGRLGADAERPTITVPSVPLAEIAGSEPIDFLKIDIEGAEVEVLEAGRHVLDQVKCLFVEYHSFADRPQQLGELLEILRDAGFRYYAERVGVRSPTPFIERADLLGMDLQLNIFAYRS